MKLIFWIIIFSIMGSLGSVGGAALLLVFPEGIRKTVVPSLVSYATGTLLGAAFLGMIPHAMEGNEPLHILETVLAGIIIFFILEKLVLWRHCHTENCEVHTTAGPLILIGDAFHNFVDGVVIAAAFLTSVSFGIAASLAVVAHEIPQEIGDFGILLESGYSRQKAFLYNILSSVPTLPGAIIAYFYLRTTEAAVPYILALSAASFIYIAVADLIPVLHQKAGAGASFAQLLLLLAGVGTILFFQFN